MAIAVCDTMTWVSRTNTQWTTDADGIVVIRQTDANRCYQCMYVIGVYSFGTQGSGTISGEFTGSEVSRLNVRVVLAWNLCCAHSWWLGAGSQLYGVAELQAGESEYYRVFTWSYDVIALRITPLYGDVDLLASSTSTHPSPDNHMWASSWNEVALFIDTPSMPGCADSRAAHVSCEAFVSVYATSNASFVVDLVLARGYPMFIKTGYPQFTPINGTVATRYSLSFRDNSPQDVHFSVMVWSGEVQLSVVYDQYHPPGQSWGWYSMPLERCMPPHLWCAILCSEWIQPKAPSCVGVVA